MKIVKTFDARYSDFQLITNIDTVDDRFVPVGGVGAIASPTIHPRLAIRFFGFEVHQPQGITVALTSDDQNMAFVDGAWQPSPSVVYQSVELMRDRIAAWKGGPLVFKFQLAEDAKFASFSIGYEVLVDLTEYLLGDNFPLCNLLSQPVRYARVVPLLASGGAIAIPPGYEGISPVFAKDFTGAPSTTEVVDGKITVTPPIAASYAQLVFDFNPVAYYSRHQAVHQISQLPEILVREANIQSAGRFNPESPIQVGEDVEFDSATRCWHLELSVTVLAADEGAVRAIANDIVERIRQQGNLYAPAFDLTFGLTPKGNVEIVSSTQDLTAGRVPQAQFRVILRGLST